MISHTRRSALLSMLGLTALHLCADEPDPVTPPYNTMSDEQEISFGHDIAKQIEKQKGFKLIEIENLQNYVNQAFERVFQSSRRPNLPYSIKIVDTAKVNAYSIPGGAVYLNRGLMEFARDESELMGVLAHEVGHVVGRHVTNRVCAEVTADSLASQASHVLFGDDTPARVAKQIGSPIAAIALLKYSRDQESEADMLGFYNLQRAGWSPQGMVNLFNRLDRMPQGLQSILALGSDHPASADRAEMLSSEMKRFPPSSSLVMNSEAFQGMQAQMKTLPPLPKSAAN